MNLLKIKQAILTLSQEELRELNSYVVNTSKQLSKQKKFEFYVGQKITCEGDIFTISKINRSKAKCLKEGTSETWNIPFGMMQSI